MVEQRHQIVNPTALDLHSQTLRLQGRHQLIQHIGAAFATLDQHINRPLRPSASRDRTGAQPPLDPVGFEGIGHQKQGIPWRTIGPVAQGVATDRNHRDPRRQIKSIAAAMGLIDHRAPAQTLQGAGNIKPPAHDPKGITWRRLSAQQIVEEGVLVTAFPIGDHLRRPQRGQQASGLQRHTETTTTKTGSGARHQNPNGIEPHGGGFRWCHQAAAASVLPAR